MRVAAGSRCRHLPTCCSVRGGLVIGIGAVVVASAVAVGAVAAGFMGPRLRRRRMEGGRMSPEHRAAFDFRSASVRDTSTAPGPVEAKRQTGQGLPGTGA